MLAERRGRPGPPSLDDVLAEVIDRLPPGLVSAARGRSLRHRCRLLPAQFAQSVLFECRLGRPEGPVDLSVCVSPSRHMHTWIGRSAPPDRNGHAVPTWWERLRDGCRRWKEQEEEWLNSLWIELDQLTDLSVDPAEAANLLVRSAPRAPLLRVLRWLHHMQGETLSNEQRQVLHRLHRTIPSGGWMSGIGTMLQRRTTPIQVFFKGLTGRSALRILRTAGWEGPLEHCRRWRRLYPPPDLQHTLAVDVTGRDAPSRLAVETRVPAGPLASRWRRWKQVLHRLVDCKVVRSDTVSDVEAWIGGGVVRLPHLWGRRLQVRALSHLKTTIDAQGRVEVKAYLAAYLRNRAK